MSFQTSDSRFNSPSTDYVENIPSNSLQNDVNSIVTFNCHESNVRSYCRNFPVVLERASGSRVSDESGREYIDLFCGAGALNYGHNPVRQRNALLQYISTQGISHSLDFHTVAKREFIEDFQSIILTPRDLRYRMMFCGPTGTNAVEAALKLARKVTGRVTIGAFTNGFHGMSLGALAATGSSQKRRGAGMPLAHVDRYPFDCYFGPDVDSIACMEKLLEDPSSGYDLPAAFLLETVQAEGGINVATGLWIQRLFALARKHGIVTIIDDIQAGCGRTCDFFSFEALGVTPDIVCLSKSLSGYGLPMSLLLLKPEIDIWTPGEHNGTFRGNNLAFVTARAALQEWRDEDFHQGMRTNCETLEKALAGFVSAGQGALRIRGRGLIWGIDVASAQKAQAVSMRAFEQGVIMETCGAYDEVVKILPPLNMNPSDLDQALSILGRILAEAV